MAKKIIPLVTRGRVISSDLVEYDGRINGLHFSTPNVRAHLRNLVLADCSKLSDLYTITLDEIIDYLVELGKRLEFDKNEYLQEAYEISKLASNLPAEILESMYRFRIGQMLNRPFLEDMVDAQIGRETLEGWQPFRHQDGRTVNVRAYGSRSAHIIPGNVPLGPVTQVIRAALTRGDIILKAPSNDPATASAIARTMVEIDPSHPISRHVVAAYWKGGDQQVERIVYSPQFIDKLVVWGGDASIKHARNYMQPGLSIHCFDPKYSNSIIGREVFESEEATEQAAFRLACDIGGLNQEGCVNSRVAYVECGTNQEGIDLANRFGEMVFHQIRRLPRSFSSHSKVSYPRLAEQVDELIAYGEDYYRVFRDEDRGGAIIVSQSNQAVEFSELLEGRTGNIVPVDSTDEAVRRLNFASQTVGIFPDKLRERIRHTAALHGVQRLTTLGYATSFSVGNRLDAVEPLREMCRWVIDEDCSSDEMTPPWLEHVEASNIGR